jgi:branched-chain amino acid transport system substrate-binding protein
MNQMTQLYQKLILEDQVDFLLPPVSTAFLSAAVPIAAQYGYLMIGAEGGSSTLKEQLAKYPGFFSVLNYSETQIPAIVDLCLEQDIKTAYIVYIQDTHGIEYSEAAIPAFAEAGIEILECKSVPADLADTTPIVTDAMNSGADVFILFAYPQINYPAISVAKAIGYNPKMIIMGPGGSFESMKDALGGDEGVEGIVFEGAWNTKSSPEAEQFAKDLQEFNKDDPAFGMDWWGHIVYYASLEVLQQAIEGAGTLDNSVIAEYIKNNHFNVSMGEIWFENQEIAHECFLGDLGQWQNGYPEVVDADENRTADPIVPKPEWAAE